MKDFNFKPEDYCFYINENSTTAAKEFNEVLKTVLTEYWEQRKTGMNHKKVFNQLWNRFVDPLLEKYTNLGTGDTEVILSIENMLEREIEGV